MAVKKNAGSFESNRAGTSSHREYYDYSFVSGQNAKERWSLAIGTAGGCCSFIHLKF